MRRCWRFDGGMTPAIGGEVEGSVGIEISRKEREEGMTMSTAMLGLSELSGQAREKMRASSSVGSICSLPHTVHFTNLAQDLEA